MPFSTISSERSSAKEKQSGSDGHCVNCVSYEGHVVRHRVTQFLKPKRESAVEPVRSGGGASHFFS